MADTGSASAAVGAVGNVRPRKDAYANIGNQVFAVSDQEIRATLYIADDRRVAAYHGVDVERVARIRRLAPTLVRLDPRVREARRLQRETRPPRDNQRKTQGKRRRQA